MKIAACASLVFFCSVTALADSWAFPKKLMKKEFEFGESKIVVEIDGRKSQGFPPHTLYIYAKGQLQAQYKNVAFDKVYTSEDNQFFVGASNTGIPGTAFVVFDAKGNLLREVKHRFVPPGMYTSQSITLIRRWFDEADPNVQFLIRDDRLVGVSIRGSNKQTYDLLKPDFGFRDK